jgi:hypothetical protein
MRNCPVCGESFGDELNFCDVDGAQLERDPADVTQQKNKLWSILGVALVVGALVISALSIIFLPKGRVSSPALVSSQPQPASPSETKLATAETSSNAEPSSISSEPGTLPAPDSVAPELKKREAAPGHENANLSKSAKAAAQSGEESEKPAPEPQSPTPAPVTAKKPETPSVKTAGEKRETETPRATAPPPTDPKSAGTKPDNSNSKKKGGDDKDKKKGGFFKVFKKIFGKD